MTDTPAMLIGKLKSLGYELYLDGDKVKFRYTIPGDPPADKVKPLLDELRNYKENVITHLRVKNEFNRLAGHLRQRVYSPENMKKLKELASQMDDAWKAMDYPDFKKAIDAMLQIPGEIKPEGDRPIAARIRSKALGAEVWVVTSPEAMSLCPEGAVVYHPEEIRNLRGATPEEIRAVHQVKKELGGKLIAVNQKGEG